MDEIRQRVHVTFEFPVVFTTGVFEVSNSVLRDLVAAQPDPAPADAVIVVDDGVLRAHAGLAEQISRYFEHHADVLMLGGPVLSIPGGEPSKNDARTLDRVHELIHRAALCRHSYVIAIGGGAVLDAVGYAAATAHRGIRLIRVPTTVLSQDDSAVGVKNGVNGFNKKNYFGTFAPPFAVINDSAFLRTLEDRDWLSGVTEAIKAALIKDAAFFARLEELAPRLTARDPEAMAEVVRRSATLHLHHISSGGDPFELGSSRPLDFGHWAAHRLEHLTAHRIRHGEAVAIGIALDCTYACLMGHLSVPDWQRIVNLLLAMGQNVYVPELGAHLEAPDHPRSVLRGLAEFREHLGGELTIMMLGGIGRAFDVHTVRTEVMIRSVEILKTIEAVGSTEAARAQIEQAAGRLS
jgi:3-dehydroquinate synthase